MIALPNPWFILGAISVSVSAYVYGHHKGWVDRDIEMQAEIAKLNEESRTKEQELNKSVTEKSYALRKANDEITKKQSDISKLVDDGRLRLPTPSCVPATTNASPAPRNREEARPDPYGETIKAIVALAIEGDRNTQQLNACISTYNEVREKLNGNK